MKTIIIKSSSEEITIGKVVCVGRNYADHAKEMGNEIPDKFPIVFMKTATCMINSGENVVHPDYSENLHHEIELVLLVGKTVKNATLEESQSAIAGYAVGLDMTLRDLQFKAKDKGEPWTFAKIFDTSGVISNFVSVDEYNLTGNERIYLSVNGEIRQEATIGLMLFNSAEIIKNISSRMTLEAGDLIFTGTPAGVSRVIKGDKLLGGIENIGEIETTIV
ncbi:MAG: fumarylacetoacetate hydrolase family protein [Bacteroidetes bacterium]|nr:fumarylacetoacetate hydrolase family protein [Bacteroidota bacterium]MBU1113829.1 fumarylacetoacetate hydrolase family protein [Bacteroidota bacterium]MBU1798213.1 fumarylacetoacetate hydrolase family protein [Bacteroidota bacterium]